MTKSQKAWAAVQPKIKALMAAIKSEPTNAILRAELRAVMLPFAVTADFVPARA